MDSGLNTTDLAYTELFWAGDILDICLGVSRTAFAIILLGVSQIPIGLTPGRLSRAMSRQAVRGDRPFGSTREVHMRFQTGKCMTEVM